MKAFDTHTGYNLIQPDQIQKTMDFHKIAETLTLCEQVGGTACYVIEHESDPEHAFEAAKKCLDYVASLPAQCSLVLSSSRSNRMFGPT